MRTARNREKRDQTPLEYSRCTARPRHMTIREAIGVISTSQKMVVDVIRSEHDARDRRIAENAADLSD
jgi:hypothetical protein